MKKIVISTILFIYVLGTSIAMAGGVLGDFNGDNFFRYPMEDVSKKETSKTEVNEYNSIPPLKLMRYKYREFQATKPQRDVERSKKKAAKQAIKDYKNNKNLTDMNVLETPTDEDIEHLETAGIEHTKGPQRVVITCEDMDFSTETSILNANGNVVVHFVQEDTKLYADHILFDKKSNHISALGNVRIAKKGFDVTGESINVNLNEENILIDKPLSKLSKVSISAEKGYVFPNKIVQENGSITVDSSFPINLEPRGRAPKLKKMMIGEDDRTSIEDFAKTNGVYRIKVSEIIINSDKKIESLELKKAQIFKGDKKVVTLPWVRLYTNKNHDFVESDFVEIGSRRNLGMFIGPGWAIKLPGGAMLKLAPIATYRSKIGVGGFARFLSGTNTTEVGYGTSKSKFVVRGEQALDDHLRLEYAANDYMDNWFLGRRMPKYGANLIYERSFNNKDFLKPGMDMKFTHQGSFGMFADAKTDGYYKKLHGDEHTTVRGRYMAEVAQKIYSFKNQNELLASDLSIVAQGSGALYGTGDTQFIGRIGPRIHTQYKRWMQDVGYFQSAYHDETPLPVFDCYRYGRSSVYLREYFRVNRYLTLSWLGKVTLSDDRWNNSIFQECSFFVSVGPDDLKMNVGYDVVRCNAYVNFSVALDSKGTVVDYDKLEIKNPENFMVDRKRTFYFGEPVEDKTTKVLKQAVVEDILYNEDTDEL